MEREIELFNNYYSNFDDSVSDIHRKYEHTFRVVEYAERVARSLNLSEEDVKLACICALFHDLGRFPQWTEFQTYVDADSFDHGEKSYEILNEMGYDNDIVKNAVRYHNKFDVPEYLSERDKMFCYITRDADKLDIMKMQPLYIMDEEYEVDDSIQESLNNKELVSHKDIDKKGYNFYKHISFVFDIVYKETFRIANENNLINGTFDIIADKFGEDVIKDNRKMINDYIKERMDESC